MAIKDLQPRQGKVDIVVQVVSIEEPREFEKFGRKGKVANAIVKDDSGEMKLTLWNDQVDEIKPGQTVHVTNGYVNEYQGEMQLTAGRFGKLEVVGSDEKAASVTDDEMTEEEAPKGEKTDKGEHVLTDDEKKESDMPVEEEKVE